MNRQAVFCLSILTVVVSVTLYIEWFFSETNSGRRRETGVPAYAAQEKYPPPRFPSYIKKPSSIKDVMPFARAAVRQAGGRTPLGLVEKGMTMALITEASAEDMVIEAIKRAFEERGVNVQIVPNYELVGVTKEEALKVLKATRLYTLGQGYMEAA
jgi:hypothetical protein